MYGVYATSQVHKNAQLIVEIINAKTRAVFHLLF